MAKEVKKEKRGERASGMRTARFRILLKVLIIALLASSLVYGFKYIQKLRQGIDAKIAQAEMKPDLDAAAQSIKKDLKEQADSLNRIKSMIVTVDNLPEAIKSIEARAAKLKLEVAIPTLTEIVDSEDAGGESFAGRDAKRVRLTIKATGRPQDLVGFLHGLESSPFLIEISKWDIYLGQKIPRLMPGRQAPGVEQPEPAVVGSLEADLMFLMQTHDKE